jgi:hypothetical protein
VMYGSRHRKTSPCDVVMVIPVCHKGQLFFLFPTFSLSKWYWGAPLRH